MQKRALAIHDISCVGRCSLTVALPVLSACGVHTSALPTALLSTHTGEFTGYTCLDLTDEMQRIADHFATLPLRFDGLYTGFLGSFEQIELVGDVLGRYRGEDTLTLVDPVMGDHGRLYATYTEKMAKGMGELCRQADVIVPNLTEACILLDQPYEAAPDEKTVCGMMERLAAKYGCGSVVMTGVRRKALLGAACFDVAKGSFGYAGGELLDGVFYGTGDVLASALLGAMLCDCALEDACRIAVDFTHEAMAYTLQNKLPLRYGVAFEQAIPALVRALGL